MRGYPQFSFWISIGLVKIYISCIITHRGKNIFKGWFPYDRRRSQKVLRSSAIIWKHISAIACDQTIAEDRTMFYLLRSSAIICDRLRSCDHMETKVLRSAIEMYPIILTDDSTFLSHKARMFDYSNAHLL